MRTNWPANSCSSMTSGSSMRCSRLRVRSEVARYLEPAHAGHLDIEQEHLRAARRNALDRLEAVTCFADHLGRQLARDVLEQLLQPLARRRFVVGDEDAHCAHREATR